MVAARVSMKMVMNTIQIAAWGTERPVSGLNLPEINNCKGFRLISTQLITLLKGPRNTLKNQCQQAQPSPLSYSMSFTSALSMALGVTRNGDLEPRRQ